MHISGSLTELEASAPTTIEFTSFPQTGENKRKTTASFNTK
jgi:hypothetical protein